VAWHKPGSSWDEDRWELYNTNQDFTQANDLAAQNPKKLAELGVCRTYLQIALIFGKIAASSIILPA
jgi:arylsulfatase A-like enzyme